MTPASTFLLSASYWKWQGYGMVVSDDLRDYLAGIGIVDTDYVLTMYDEFNLVAALGVNDPNKATLLKLAIPLRLYNGN